MRTTKWILALATLYCSFFLNGCHDDDHDHDHEPELITTLRLTFTPVGGGAAAVMEFKDLDGDGGSAPVITTDPLTASASYNVTVELLNESVTPADTITHEIEEEDEDHQFFFQPAGGLNLTFTYADTDDEGHPVGLSSTAQAGAASSDELTVTLLHEPDKHAAGVEDGDITNAGGHADIEVTFDVVVQ